MEGATRRAAPYRRGANRRMARPAWEFQADAEEKQGDTEIRNGAQHFSAFFSESLENESCDEKTDQGGETHLLRKETEEKGDRDEQGIHEAESRSVAGLWPDRMPALTENASGDLPGPSSSSDRLMTKLS